MRVLLAEDEFQLAAALVELLQDEGHQVDHVASGAEARQRGRSGRYDLILLDRNLPPPTGDELLAEWDAAGETTPVVLLSGQVEAPPATRRGVRSLVKPFPLASLLAVVAEVAAPPSRGAGG